MTEIQLGDEVRCRYTDFKGIATARTLFINGCVQYTVTAKWKGGDIAGTQELDIDSQSLVVTKPAKINETDEGNGGPMRISKKMKGH